MRHLIALFASLCVLINGSAMAQNGLQISLSQPVHVVDANTLKHQGQLYHLWGTADFSGDLYKGFNNRNQATNFLRESIGSGAVTCFSYAQNRAQCFNSNSEDLSLALIKKGFASVAYDDIAGTRYEGAFTQAEQDAKTNRQGIWAVHTPVLERLDQVESAMSHFTILAFILFILTGAAVVIMTMVNKKSADKVHLQLNNTIQLLSREAKVHQREVDLTAVMIHAELKSNQSKVDAYLMIYQDLLKTLKDPYADHRYLKAGEVVRTAPALDRYIYDANVSKLDAFGEEVVPYVVALYNKIDANPDYSNLEPDMDHQQAVDIVSGVVENAQNLKSEIDNVVELCGQKGFVAANLTFAS